MHLNLLYQLQLGSASVFLLSLPLVADAQEVTALQTALNRCYAISSVADRVDCYDALARAGQVSTGQLRDAPSAPPAAAVPSTSPTPSTAGIGTNATVSETPASTLPAAIPSPASAAATVAEFGPQAKVRTSTGEQAEFVDTVAAVKRVEPTKLQITLASGQIWRQTVGKTFLIREGETVRIRPSGWGKAYRLSVDGRAEYIQVGRQQ